ncbi:translocation protein SEC63 homolog [Styela clava]|uniref:translocation protein SEC63 homolog n=1 Tax=Styela clava TaxID=7725 RepID=UPI00193985E8|nr:translocation protein SEC63 homolog [Styela clava]
MAQINYDEKGTTFLYFIVSFFAMVLIPATYYLWPKGFKEEEKRLQKLRSIHAKSKWYKKCLEELQKKRKKPSFRKIFIVLAWIGFFILAYKVSMIERDFVEYDPYEVLGIREGADNVVIKKAYRKLSKEFHPDKGGDPAVFMRIRKAYEALTDEATRKNWEEYGNPDGPQAMEFGIALPSWIVDSENSVVVLGLYVLAFMIILPIIVGIWWNRSIKYSKEKVLLSTTQLYYYFFNRTPNMNLKRALTILSASFEFSRDHNPEVRAPTPADNIDIPDLIRILGTPFDPKGREAPLHLPYSVKARTLIYCHLAGHEAPDNLLEDLDYILRKCPLLVQEMVNCLTQLTALAHADRASLPRLETVETVMKLSPTMVQGLKETKSPLLQLPYFSDDYVKFCLTKKISVRNLKTLSKINDHDRRQMLRRMGDEEYDTMVACLKSLPMLEVDVHIQVLDDEEAHIITAGAIVTVTVSLIRKKLGDLEEDPPRLAGVNSSADKQGDGDEMEQNNVVTKTKVWEKQSKKKKGAKKKPKKAAQKKPTQQQPQHSDTTEKSGEEASGDKADMEKVDDTKGDMTESELSDTETSADSYDDEDEWEAMQQTFKKKRKKMADTGDKMTHTVYAPNFPLEKQEWWWVYICSRKRHLLLTVPVQVCNLADSQEVELKFPAPQSPGRYSYDVWVRSDSYLDCDVKKELKFNVEEAKEIDEDHPQWKIEDSEEEDESAVVEESEDEGISTDETSDEE